MKFRAIYVAGARENVDWRRFYDDETAVSGSGSTLYVHGTYSRDMSYDREHDDQDDNDDLAKERDLLASLIAKLKCEIDDKSSNTHFKEANDELKKTKQMMFRDLKKFQDELEKRHDVNYMSKVELDCAKEKTELIFLIWKKELVAHQETISIMSQQKEEQIKFYKTCEEKELEKVIALENKFKALNDFVYKTGQSVQTMNMLNRNCKTSFVKPEFFKKAQRANPRLYDIGLYNDNLALMLAPDSDDTIRLAKKKEYYYANHMNAILGVYTTLNEFTDLQCDYVDQVVKCERLEKELSKSNSMSKSFEALQQYAINLELDLQHCQEQIKNDKAFKETQSTLIQKEREQYFEIQDLKAQLQDKNIALCELKKVYEKLKRQSVETKFKKPSVIRQPNAFKSQRQLILGKPTTFSDSLAKKDLSKSKSVTKNDFSNAFLNPVNAQILPQNVKSILKNTNVIAPGMYKVNTNPDQTRTPQLPQDIRKTNKRVSFSTGVIPTTSVSRPPFKSNRMEDIVLPNNSQGKMKEIEDHHRNLKFSKNITFVTTCNDSLNAKTSNVNFVCLTCEKCVLNDNHDMCVLHYINGMISRTKQPVDVPISTREPKRTANQSVATSLKKTVATKSTVKKPRSIIRKIYEHVSKTCSWWYPKFTPSGYKWKPKSPIGIVNTNVSMPLGNLVEIILFIVDSGCSKHMMGNLKLLTNFVEKFLGTVKFGNDQIASILGYGDLGNDLLTGSHGSDLYSITLQDSSTPNPIFLMAKATSSQAWLWHRRLSHLNFDTINLLSKNDIVTGLPKLKFIKDHLCSSCELGKAKQKPFHTKTTPSSKRRLQLLHMDLCGPMRVESINGKKYVLVIVDNYSRYTWTHFLRSIDETPEVLIDFLKLVQRGLHAQVRTVRTDKGTEFLNKTLHAYFTQEGIRHETSTARTPEQNGVVKRRNRTLVEATRTMLSAAKVPLFFWAEAISTTCFTHNRSLIIPRHEKTPYHIINGRKPSVKFFHIFGSLCYIVRDGENLDKMKEKGDACIFVGYSTQSRAYRVFNKRTRVIVETIHVNFDELPQMASDHVSSDPVPTCPTPVLEQVSLSPEPQSQENVPQAAETVIYVVNAADAPNKCQQQNTYAILFTTAFAADSTSASVTILKTAPELHVKAHLSMTTEEH
ncbi:retrovirus-related pol polyprotein from transposon TNT 1-94 [Tanacetum coccineum]